MQRGPQDPLREIAEGTNAKGPGKSPGPFNKYPRIYKPDPVLRCLAATKAPPSIWDHAHARPRSTYPLGSSGPPLSRPRTGAPAYLVFQPVGFTKLPRSHAALVGSYPTFSSLPPSCDGLAVSLSAALSMAPPSPVVPLPVRKHGALCCPDFPPSPPCGGKNGGAMRGMSMNVTGIFRRSLNFQPQMNADGCR